MMMKIACFDFCGTLVSFQTANAFIDFVRKRNGNFYMKFLESFLVFLIKMRIIAILNIFFPDAAFEKKIRLLELRGQNYEKLNNLAELFYKEMIKPKLIKIVQVEMKRLAKLDYEICLVSAGYSIYLNFFAKDHKIKHIISNEIAFNKSNNRCLGTLLDKDCIHDEKVSRLETYFAGHNVNYNESISFSDTQGDLPLLLHTGKGVVVSRTISPSWSHNCNFKRIIW